MKCPNCQQAELKHDIIAVFTLTCPKCGCKAFLSFPRRTAEEHDAMLKAELDKIKAELVAAGLAGEERKGPKLCATCGKVEIPETDTYCKPCKRARTLAAVNKWKAKNPEKWKAIKDRAQQKRVKKHQAQGAVA